MPFCRSAGQWKYIRVLQVLSSSRFAHPRSPAGLQHQNMVIPENGITWKCRSGDSERPSYRLARQLVAVRRKEEMLAQAYSCPRKKLAAKQVPENGRNVRRFAELVHGADFPSEEERPAGGKRIDVWCGDHRNSSRSEQTPDVSEETDGALDVFDDLDGCD